MSMVPSHALSVLLSIYDAILNVSFSFLLMLRFLSELVFSLLLCISFIIITHLPTAKPA
jgi:hypothetical protein